MYKVFIKRLIDFTLSLVAFIFLFPIFVIISFLLWSFQGGSPFFTQLRPGKDIRPFKVIKFKTMRDKRDGQGNLLPDELRLTGIGKIIRKTSLDEIPQLLNVISGHMSLIGPRPLLMEYLKHYSPAQNRRHEVKPGITGWAQVNGRNTVSWKDKFEMDVYYVDHLSFLLDVKIFIKTISKVFKAEGISSATSETMEKFTGQ